MVVATTMVKLLFAMACGFFLRKKGILTQDSDGKFSALVLNVTCPCLVLSSIASVSHDNPSLVLILFLAGVVCYILYPIIGFIMVRILRVPKDLRGTYTCMFIFSNCAFMAYPVVQAFFGDQAIFYLSIFNLMYNVMFYSLGINMIRKDAERSDLATEKEPFNIKNYINIGIVASVAALVIYFANIPLPDMFYTSMGFVGNITTPLSMIIIGSSMAAVSFKEIVGDKRIWTIVPLRLAVMPILGFFFLQLFFKDPTILKICTIGIGMPIGSMIVMGATKYPKQGKHASMAVVLTTLVSMISIPIMAVILGV